MALVFVFCYLLQRKDYYRARRIVLPRRLLGPVTIPLSVPRVSYPAGCENRLTSSDSTVSPLGLELHPLEAQDPVPITIYIPPKFRP